ncbi:MAG: sensor histidine kinase, partial [Caldanaerobacter sp.]
MILKLKSWFMGLNIRHKILILFYGVVVITSLLIVLFSYTISINQLKEEVGNSLLRDTKRIAASIDFLQRDVNELSSFLVLDQRIQNFISPHSDFTKYSLGPLASLLASKDYISFIALYSFQGDKYYFSNDSSTLIMDLELIKRTSFYREVLDRKGAPLWVSLENLPFDLILKNNYPKIAMARVLLDFNTYRPEGLLVICINIPTIEKVYSENLKEKESAFFIADRNGNIISFKSTFSGFTPKSAHDILTKYLKDKQNVVININSSKLLVTSSLIPTSDWRLVSVVSLKNAINSVRISFIRFYLRILAFCLIFAFLVSMYFSKVLTRPLEKLANSMKKVRQGNLEEKVEFEYHSKDEIAVVIREYNRMVERINELINKILKLEINKKEAELKALEAQINPHFLYNTLDTIFWKAEKAKDKELSEMIYSLSRLFRLTLNRGEEFIQV